MALYFNAQSMNDIFIHQEIPAEALRRFIETITGDNSVIMSAGNSNLFASSVASCRYVSELTFKSVTVCFLRPQRANLRVFEKNDYFTLSYFSPQYREILDSLGTGLSSEKINPVASQMGNMFYSEAELVFECRKVVNLELILSNEIQTILATEKKRTIYPGNEQPRMFIGEIINGWYKVLQSFSNPDVDKLLPESPKINFLETGEK